jgi:hypothetical protein
MATIYDPQFFGPAQERSEFHCGSCGQPVAELKPCVRDTTNQVCSLCETYIDNQCPDCGSDNLDYREYDYGRDSETSYHNAGVWAIWSGLQLQLRRTGYGSQNRPDPISTDPTRRAAGAPPHH